MQIFAQKQRSTLSGSEERLVQALQLLGDKTRFRIFKLLMSKKKLCVSEIADELGVTLSAVSQHFRQFELVGLVDSDRIGQRICYKLDNNDLVQDLVVMLKKRK
jgi:ArsR family transcriptional regulator, arsenate/arsenite/antimonite-responsive transcriptional repressor